MYNPYLTQTPAQRAPAPPPPAPRRGEKERGAKGLWAALGLDGLDTGDVLLLLILLLLLEEGEDPLELALTLGTLLAGGKREGKA